MCGGGVTILERKACRGLRAACLKEGRGVRIRTSVLDGGWKEGSSPPHAALACVCDAQSYSKSQSVRYHTSPLSSNVCVCVCMCANVCVSAGVQPCVCMCQMPNATPLELQFIPKDAHHNSFNNQRGSWHNTPAFQIATLSMQAHTWPAA